MAAAPVLCKTRPLLSFHVTSGHARAVAKPIRRWLPFFLPIVRQAARRDLEPGTLRVEEARHVLEDVSLSLPLRYGLDGSSHPNDTVGSEVSIREAVSVSAPKSTQNVPSQLVASHRSNKGKSSAVIPTSALRSAYKKKVAIKTDRRCRLTEITCCYARSSSLLGATSVGSQVDCPDAVLHFRDTTCKDVKVTPAGHCWRKKDGVKSGKEVKKEHKFMRRYKTDKV